MIKFFAGDSPERRMDRLIAQGERLFQHGKEREGLEKFAEAAEILPEASKPSLYLGRAYFKRQEYDLALNHYYKGLYFCEIHDEPSILCEVAQVYLSMRRYDMAEEKLKKALRLDPHFSVAIKGLAHLYHRTGRFSEALKHQKILWQDDPENLQMIRQLVQSYRVLGEYREARGILQNAIKVVRSASHDAEREELLFQIRELSFPDGIEFGIKERLYARHGSICLGTAGDNGLELRSELSQFSVTELKMTLRRLLTCVQACSWNITCVVACDKCSALLAFITAELLGIPCKPLSQVEKTDRVLVCQLYLKESKQIRKLLKKLRRRVQLVVTFGVLTILKSAENEYTPDIIGIPIREQDGLLWKNANHLLSQAYHETEFWGMGSLSSEMFVSQFLDELYALPQEKNIEQQMAYYSRNSCLLRKHLVPSPHPMQSAPSSQNASIQPLLNELHSKHKGLMYATLTHICAEDVQSPEIFSTLKTLYLEHQNIVMRKMIGAWMLKTDQEAGLKDLLSLFYNPDSDIPLKQSLLDVLCVSSRRIISDVIVSALQSPEDALRIHASQYLDRLDRSRPLSELFKKLLRDIPVIIVRTVQYLRARRSPLLRASLCQLLRYDALEVIHEALKTVQQFRERSCLRLVVLLLNHDAPQIVRQAIETLGFIGDIDLGYQLLPFLEHEDAQLRYAAAASLTKLGHQRSVVFLMERLRKESLDVQEKLLILLGEVGLQETVPFIVHFAEQHLEQLQIVAAAMKIFVLLKNPRCLPFVRKVVARFSHQDILLQYISIIRAIGEEKDVEDLIMYLGFPPTIQFRVAALLYQKGFPRYFQILQDGIRSKRVSVILLTLEVLSEIDDVASRQLLFSAFKKEIFVVDRKIVEILYRQRTSEISVRLFQRKASSEAERILKGIHRTIQASQSLEEVMRGIAVLYLFLESSAIPAIQSLITPESSSIVQCGALRSLAQYDPVGSRELIEICRDMDHIDIANTAVMVLEELHQPAASSESQIPAAFL